MNREVRNWAHILRREEMQGEQRRQMVGQMVLAATGAAHGDRTFGAIESDRQLRQVEPRRKISEFGLELPNILRNVRRNVTEHRRQAFIAVVGADLRLKLLDLVVETAIFPF